MRRVPAARLKKAGPAKPRGVATIPHDNRQHYTRLVNDSLHLQDDLRRLTRQVLTAQEDQHTSLSRVLQNEIAQTLMGINVRLLALQKEGRSKRLGLKQGIASTQQLVTQSARTMRRVILAFRDA
jgi:signal transduction histidine kinase